jgi:prevent-host-death family protein
MQSVNIRELINNFAHYLKEVKAGEQITILERQKPIADIVPHNANIRFPGWKRTLVPRKVGGEAFSQTVIKNRESFRAINRFCPPPPAQPSTKPPSR